MNRSKQFVFSLLFLFPFMLFAQEHPPVGFGEEGESNPDLQGRKEKTIVSHIDSWKITDFGTFSKPFPVDTSQHEFQKFIPFYKNAVTASYTGNYGGSYLNNDFFSRNYNTDFYFLKTHDAYLLTPSILNYYNTTTPFTLLDYSQSESRLTKNETRFNVLHTQNVNPYMNVTFRYDQAKSAGQYLNQENKNNFITLYSSYEKDNLNIYGGFITNRIYNQENGGITSDNLIFDIDKTEYMDVNLSNTTAEYRSNYFFTTAEYKLGKSVQEDKDTSEVFKPILGITYSFSLNTNLRKFEEDDPNFTYFPETYIDSTATYDSTRFNIIRNFFQLKYYENADRKFTFGKRVYIGADIVKIAFPGSVTGTSKTDNYSDIYFGGGIFRTLGKFWKWNFEGRVYITGEKSGQTQLSGEISKPLKFFGDSLASINIEGKIENLAPDYFQQNYFSNHAKWSNNLNDEQRMTAGFRFLSPGFKLDAGVNYALINNFLYHNSLGIPSQTSKELLVLSAFLKKGFQLKNFYIGTSLLAQKASSDEYLHLPAFSANLSLYYKFVISKVLYTQLGVDAIYNTAYFADAYNPATGFFHLQNEKKLGDYPYIDAYACLKLKRTRVFFKYVNLGTEFLDKEYFTTLHYPMNKRSFRLGVAWTFYD